MSRPGRAALVLLALAAVGWLAGNLRSLDLVGDGTAPVSRLESAKRFAPDGPLLIKQGQAYALRNRAAAAERLLAQAARREPSNFDAWLLLFAVSRESDPELAARARRRAIALDPQARIPAP